MTSAYNFGYFGFSEAGLRDCTAEALRAQSKPVLYSKFSELSELCASAVSASLLGDVRRL
jgi:hypothetical protein